MRSLAKLGVLGMVIAAAAASTACSKAEEETAKGADWSCRTSAVPMGNVTTCTTRSALTGGDTSSTYDCNPAESLLCPPVGTGEGGSGATEAPSDDGSGAGGGDTTGGDGTTGEGSVGNDPNGGAGSGDGSGTGGGDDATQGSTGDGNVSGGPNDECSYVPDLDYCGGGSGGGDATNGGTDGTTGDGNVNGGSSGSSGGDCGGKTCPPGQTKKPDGPNGGNGGGASSGNGGSGGGGGASSGGGGGGGKGKKWKCEKGSSGTTCTSEPTCKPGTHPVPCGACVPDSEPPSCDCVPPTTGGCWVTGGGFVEAASIVPAGPADGHDNFGGNAKPMKDGTVKGQWNHVDHGTGNHAHGQATYLFCRKVDGPGPGQPGGKKGLTSNQVYFGGPARWRTGATWNDGYWFDVVAIDRGEPGSSAATKKGGVPDNYHITIRKQSDPVAGISGAVVYETKGGLSGGNIQIHPPNNGHPAVSSPLPAWVALED